MCSWAVAAKAARLGEPVKKEGEVGQVLVAFVVGQAGTFGSSETSGTWEELIEERAVGWAGITNPGVEEHFAVVAVAVVAAAAMED
jgi:hypothetical protein